MLTQHKRKELEQELRRLMLPKGYSEAEIKEVSDRGSDILRELIDDDILKQLLSLSDPIITSETAELAIKVGFISERGKLITAAQLQRWLRLSCNHCIVPVRIENPYDNHENYKIFLNGRPWYNGGTHIVVAGYDNCLEVGLKRSCLFLLQQAQDYNQITE